MLQFDEFFEFFYKKFSADVFKKKIDLFFAHENMKKLHSKVTHNRPQTLFFHKYGPAAQTSKELIFHIIKISQDSSVS
jgi:hypothetical protein